MSFKQKLMKVPRAVKKRWKNIVGLSLSAFMLWAGLWQSEIVDICISEGRDFDFPFYMFPSINVWVARDLFMLVIVLAFMLQFICLWKWD